MTTFQKISIQFDEPISRRVLVYFRARLRNRIHSFVLEEFARLEKGGQITRAKLGRRIGKDAAQITRWLGSAGNWTSDTLSDLMLGMGCEPGFIATSLDRKLEKQDAAS